MPLPFSNLVFFIRTDTGLMFLFDFLLVVPISVTYSFVHPLLTADTVLGNLRAGFVMSFTNTQQKNTLWSRKCPIHRCLQRGRVWKLQKDQLAGFWHFRFTVHWLVVCPCVTHNLLLDYPWLIRPWGNVQQWGGTVLWNQRISACETRWFHSGGYYRLVTYVHRRPTCFNQWRNVLVSQ